MAIFGGGTRSGGGSGGGLNFGDPNSILNALAGMGPSTSYQGLAALAPGAMGGGGGGLAAQQIAGRQTYTSPILGASYARMQPTVNMRNDNSAQVGALASMIPASMQQQRFNTIFPYLTGQLNARQQSPLIQVTPQSTPRPEITVRPIYDEAQVQSQVNAMRARNDVSLASRMNEAQQRAAGSGYGANSPILEATRARLQAANTAANTQGELDMRTQLAGANAAQILRGQTARSDQANQQAQEAYQYAALNADLASRQRQLEMQFQNTLLSALAGLV